MILSKSRSLIILTRFVSTESAKNASAESIAVDPKDSYYKKIGYGVSKENEGKPEGWDEAKPFEEIPGPKPIPILGNAWRFFPLVGDMHNIQIIDLHTKFREQYGDIAYFSGIHGKRPMVFCYNPDDIEKVLRNEGPWPIRYGMTAFVHYRKNVRKDVFQDVGGVLTSQGEEWFNIRSIVNKILMQPRTAEMYVGSMDTIARDLIDNIRHFSKASTDNLMPEDFQNELYKWALESIGVISYNKRFGALKRDLSSKDSDEQKYISSVVEMFELFFKLEVLPSLWPYISTKTWRRAVELLDFLTDVNQRSIAECIRAADPNPNIPDHERSVLERLLKKDRKVAVAMTTDMVIAGVDTTGRTMAAALYFLAKNPDKQKRFREELKKHLPSKESAVTKEMLKDSPYLKAVIKETTRLAPIAPGNMRTTIKDLVLSGYRIPKGTDVVSANILLSHDEKYYVKPKEFIPERWLRTTQENYSYKNVHPFVTLPFGFGPRSCIGKRLANLELEVGLSKIIRNFELSWPHPDAKFGAKLLYGIEDPLRYKVVEAAD